MATDATGTPTSPDNIPTYATSADAPSGKGFNAAMAIIQTALTSRLKLNTSPTVTGQVPVWNNATSHWDPGSVASGSGAPVTTLPVSPTDGQQSILTDSTTVPTYAWLLQWSATASKWIFIGGSPAVQENSTDFSIASAVYVDPTPSMSITVPRAGSYLINFGATGADLTGTNTFFFKAAPKLGAAAAADADAIFVQQSIAGGSFYASAARAIKRTLAASDVVKLQFLTQGGGSKGFNDQFLTILPVTLT